jgi:hypothetical protein
MNEPKEIHEIEHSEDISEDINGFELILPEPEEATIGIKKCDDYEQTIMQLPSLEFTLYDKERKAIIATLCNNKACDYKDGPFKDKEHRYEIDASLVYLNKKGEQYRLSIARNSSILIYLSKTNEQHIKKNKSGEQHRPIIAKNHLIEIPRNLADKFFKDFSIYFNINIYSNSETNIEITMLGHDLFVKNIEDLSSGEYIVNAMKIAMQPKEQILKIYRMDNTKLPHKQNRYCNQCLQHALHSVSCLYSMIEDNKYAISSKFKCTVNIDKVTTSKKSNAINPLLEYELTPLKSTEKGFITNKCLRQCMNDVTALLPETGKQRTLHCKLHVSHIDSFSNYAKKEFATRVMKLDEIVFVEYSYTSETNAIDEEKYIPHIMLQITPDNSETVKILMIDDCVCIDNKLPSSTVKAHIRMDIFLQFNNNNDFIFQNNDFIFQQRM